MDHMNREQSINDNVIKIIVVGDGAVGKTCMLASYTEDRFPTEYVPTVFDNTCHRTRYEDQDYNLILVDTAGQEEYESIRSNNYLDANIVIICFSVCNRDSLHHVETIWKREFDKNRSSSKQGLVLCATQKDLRVIDSIRIVQTEEGEKMAKIIDADAYLECSAKTQDGLKNVFESCIRIWIEKESSHNKKQPSPSKSDKCVCM